MHQSGKWREFCVTLPNAARKSEKPFVKRPAQRVWFPHCQMNQNPSQSQIQRTESYLNRIRIERSKRPEMTSEEFYRQMERSMGTKLTPISSHGRSLVSEMDATATAQGEVSLVRPTFRFPALDDFPILTA
jgi:hypothetical protein